MGRTWTAILKSNRPKDDLNDKIHGATTSLEEILCRDVNLHEVKAALTEGMAGVLRANFENAELSSDELRLAREIASRQTFSEDRDGSADTGDSRANMA